MLKPSFKKYEKNNNLSSAELAQKLVKIKKAVTATKTIKKQHIPVKYAVK